MTEEEKSVLQVSDKEFNPTVEMMVNDFDEERTLDKEAPEESEDNQLTNLDKEGDMPLEELLAMHGNGDPPYEKSSSSADGEPSATEVNPDVVDNTEGSNHEDNETHNHRGIKRSRSIEVLYEVLSPRRKLYLEYTVSPNIRQRHVACRVFSFAGPSGSVETIDLAASSDEEKALEGHEDQPFKPQNIQKEGDMPLEELLAMHGNGDPPYEKSSSSTDGQPSATELDPENDQNTKGSNHDENTTSPSVMKLGNGTSGFQK